MNKEEIISRLKELYARRKPLNLSAAKRAYPELVEAVYAIKPFWGWKQALADAGIDYENIVVRLEDSVPCAICGEYFAYLATHITKLHGIPMSEYREEFPDSELMSEEILAERLRRNSKRHELPHWEPLITPEYVLDRIHAYAQLGHSMHAREMQRHDYGLLTKARRCFGSWDAALAKVGLVPEKVRKNAPSRSWTPELVVKLLKERHKAGLVLNSATLQVQDPGLFQYGRKFFGSHPDALKAAGIDPLTVRRTTPHRTQKDRKKLLKELRKIADFPEQPEDRKLAACRAFRKKHTPVMISFFKNWREACKELGIHPYSFRIGPRPESWPEL